MVNEKAYNEIHNKTMQCLYENARSVLLNPNNLEYRWYPYWGKMLEKLNHMLDPDATILPSVAPQLVLGPVKGSAFREGKLIPNTMHKVPDEHMHKVPDEHIDVSSMCICDRQSNSHTIGIGRNPGSKLNIRILLK